MDFQFWKQIDLSGLQQVRIWFLRQRSSILKKLSSTQFASINVLLKQTNKQTKVYLPILVADFLFFSLWRLLLRSMMISL